MERMFQTGERAYTLMDKDLVLVTIEGFTMGEIGEPAYEVSYLHWFTGTQMVTIASEFYLFKTIKSSKNET